MGSIGQLPDMSIIWGHHLLSLEIEPWRGHRNLAAFLMSRIRLIKAHPMVLFKGLKLWEVHRTVPDTK